MKSLDHIRANPELSEKLAGLGAVALNRAAEKGWSPAKALVIAFNGVAAQFGGQLIVKGERMSMVRAIRITIANAVVGHEIQSFNDLAPEETAFLMGMFQLNEVRNLLAGDCFYTFQALQKAGQEHRQQVRDDLIIRCGGYCEAWWNMEKLPRLDLRGEQPPANPYMDATDMHEIIGRGALPTDYQEVLWHPGNALMLNHWFHTEARCSIHNIGWGEWGMDLLFLVRTKDEIADFLGIFKTAARHAETEPAYNEMRRRLEAKCTCTQLFGPDPVINPDCAVHGIMKKVIIEADGRMTEV